MDPVDETNLAWADFGDVSSPIESATTPTTFEQRDLLASFCRRLTANTIEVEAFAVSENRGALTQVLRYPSTATVENRDRDSRE